jgi:death-on-curing protein
MDIIQFPPARVLEINHYILGATPGHQGPASIALLEGALGRIDNAIAYSGLNDVFLIAAKYAMAIGTAHAFSDANKRTSDANKRTGLAVCLEYLSLNDFEIERDNEKLADAMVDLVLGELPENQFANILYALWLEEQTTS